VVSSTPRPHFTPGKDPVPILQEAGWAPGQVWTGGKFRPHRDSIPDCPARSSVAIPTELIIIIIIIFLTAIGLSSGGCGYFTCKQNMKLVTTKFKSRGLHEKHVVAHNWDLAKKGNRTKLNVSKAETP